MSEKYVPQPGDLIEVTEPMSGKRERAFVHPLNGHHDGRLGIRHETGGWDYASDAKDPVLLDRAPAPWPTMPGSTAIHDASSIHAHSPLPDLRRRNPPRRRHLRHLLH